MAEDDFFSSIADNITGGGSSHMPDTMDGNSLVSALAGDATQVASAFIAADAAKTAVKKNPGSANTLILVAGGVAALFVVLLLLKK